MTVPVGLALVWVVAGAAGTVIGFQTIRRAVNEVRAARRDGEAAALVASRLGAIDDVARCEQEQLESEFSAEVLAWLESRETEEAT